MMKKILTGSAVLGALALTIALSAGASATSSTAAAPKYGPNYTPERHASMTAAFASQDYASWKKLMEQNQSGNKRVLQVVNEQNFAKFSEMHKLTLDGKTAEANAIRQELGLGQGKGKGNGMHHGNGQGRSTGRGNCLNQTQPAN